MNPPEDALTAAKAILNIEQQNAYLSPSFIQEREVFWSPVRGKTVFIGCGDDRPPTPASIEAILAGKHASILSPTKGYASIYGATAGLAKNVLVTGIAQFGESFIAAVGSFDGILGLLVQNSANPQTLHSAEGNEQDQRHFSLDGAAPVGCAYAAGIGATADLLVGATSNIRDTARAEQRYIFGTDEHFDDLLRGQQAFLRLATDQKGASFTIDREYYKHYKTQFGDRLQIMILQGSHASAKTTGVVSNFSLEQVGNPVAAHQQGLDFYRLDIAIAADIVLRALSKPLARLNPSFVLSPELLMRAFQLDATPVRAVLASADKDPGLQGKLDPSNLKMGSRGNPFDSIKTLLTKQQADFYR